MRSLLTIGFVFAVTTALTACSGGGSLSLSSTSKSILKGSPYIGMNQGAKNLTSATGVHGWAVVQAIPQQKMTATDGTSVIINKTNPPTARGPARE